MDFLVAAVEYLLAIAEAAVALEAQVQPGSPMSVDSQETCCLGLKRAPDLDRKLYYRETCLLGPRKSCFAQHAEMVPDRVVLRSMLRASQVALLTSLRPKLLLQSKV